ncbi:MAG: porphobilinogen synthase [Endozoicomonadaceae bacterium]|nr:porphobilinogen synthase [Endozoicomonadaceae bacterium]MBE8232676.1 porphobilinogen synthase [Endozoicomonadaceae bacterium]
MFKTAGYTVSSVRPRRLRASAALRSLVCEQHSIQDSLILPVFVKAGLVKKQAIASMPDHYQWSIHDLPELIENVQAVGLKALILFGIPDTKDALGHSACSETGIIQQAIRCIKDRAPELLVISDLCYCEYTDHGHCGVLKKTDEQFEIDNDETLLLLQKQAISHAEAGVDMIAPSGMMDGMVGAIRYALDQSGWTHVPILSYTVKYASALYGPFRLAAEGAPVFGDRKTYQMDPSNRYESLREAELDVEEGADLMLIKPGHMYLDILWRIAQQYPSIPVGVYHTSGEYAMIKAASDRGWLHEQDTVREMFTSFHRAGARFIMTYYAYTYCQWMTKKV